MVNPNISVALPALNSEETLEFAIASITMQTFGDWELLLMDDGSTDRTAEIARNFHDSRIRVIADSVHRGLAAQLNRAVGMARGKYLARMDADDIAYPQRLEKQYVFLESHPEVDLLGSWMAVFRSDGTLRGMRRPPADHAGICARPWMGISMAHPTWMGRTEWFRRNPYPSDAIRMEDWELLLRVCSHSCFANRQEALMGYREDSLSLRRQLLTRKNVCKFVARYGREHKKFAWAGVSIASQAAQLLLDILALSTGLGHKLLRHRALQATVAEDEEWRRVWTAVTASNTSGGSVRLAGKAAQGDA